MTKRRLNVTRFSTPEAIPTRTGCISSSARPIDSKVRSTATGWYSSSAPLSHGSSGGMNSGSKLRAGWPRAGAAWFDFVCTMTASGSSPKRSLAPLRILSPHSLVTASKSSDRMHSLRSPSSRIRALAKRGSSRISAGRLTPGTPVRLVPILGVMSTWAAPASSFLPSIRSAPVWPFRHRTGLLVLAISYGL